MARYKIGDEIYSADNEEEALELAALEFGYDSVDEYREDFPDEDVVKQLARVFAINGDLVVAETPDGALVCHAAFRDYAGIALEITELSLEELAEIVITSDDGSASWSAKRELFIREDAMPFILAFAT